MARACVSPRIPRSACVCVSVWSVECAYRLIMRERLREKKNRLKFFIPSDPRSQDTIAQTHHALLQKTIYDRIRRAAPFWWCVLWISRGFCVDPRTPKALQVERPHRTKKKQAGSGNRARGRVGLAPRLFQSGMTMFRGPRIARISSSVRQGREESSRGGTQKREASRIASRSACAFHSAKRGAKFGASCARTHPS